MNILVDMRFILEVVEYTGEVGALVNVFKSVFEFFLIVRNRRRSVRWSSAFSETSGACPCHSEINRGDERGRDRLNGDSLPNLNQDYGDCSEVSGTA